MLSEKRYVAAGDRAYVVGVQDGTLPPSPRTGIGWHITGTMGGVWSHPLKLLQSYSLLLGGSALPAAQQFTSGPGFVQLAFPVTDGLQITRTEFAPDGLPVVLIGLQIHNPGSQTVTTTVGIQPVSMILPAYPWSGTTPTSDQLDQQDNVQFDPVISGLTFSEPNRPWYAMVAGRATKQGPQDSVQFQGASNMGKIPEFKQATGQLTWQLKIAAGSTVEIWFGVSGTHVFKAEAYGALFAGLANPDGLLSQKINQRVAVLALSNVTIPDQTAQDAFNWAKLNLADMSRTVLNAEIRDTQEGKVYPPPIAEFPILTGFGAGYPDYPWFFGTDGCYTTFGLTATGQWEMAENHLNLLRSVSQAVNGGTGKVLHETVTDGSIYYGTNLQAGDTNETAEFATAVATIWRWSGDNSFRDENYDFIMAGLKYLETTLDTYPDGWPEGAGMVEANGMGAKKLDVAVYTIRALNDLTEMAVSKGDTATAKWASGLAKKLAAKFDSDWWDSSLGLYADSLALNHAVPTDPTATVVKGKAPVTQLEQYYWTNATPMETGFAPAAHAATAFPQLENTQLPGPVFTGANGFYQQAETSTMHGSQQASAVNTGVMAVAEANYGRMDESLKYLEFVASELDTEQPGALPELFDSPDYQYFQAFTGRAMVMQAWSSYGVEWPIIYHYLGIRPDVPNGQLVVIPELPSSWPTLAVSNLRVGNGTIAVSAKQTGGQYTTTLSAPTGYQVQLGYVIPAGTKPTSVTLGGTAVKYQTIATLRGNEVVVETRSGPNLSLVVNTQ
ncbi:MAG: hypothetical protein JOZ31_03940 [Verrucomicrobia bacterium]|nr:hypothetical protein [Verrucomicrobiota bacterium]